MDKYTLIHKKKTLNCSGKIINFSSPHIMGILNITPDSFYDGGLYNTKDKWLKKTGEMLNEGATFIDIGACSTRPGSKEISEQEEADRIIPAIKSISETYPEAILSVDTYRSSIAEEAIRNGAAIINDISGGKFDEKIIDIAAKYQSPLIMMHIQGTPENMQNNPDYKNVIKEILFSLSKKIIKAKAAGVADIIIDPGFGFGKTIEHNYKILKELNLLNFSEMPVLVGISRKSLINKILGTTPNDALNGTTILHTLAISQNIDILRVHDVKETSEVLKVYAILDKS